MAIYEESTTAPVGTSPASIFVDENDAKYVIELPFYPSTGIVHYGQAIRFHTSTKWEFMGVSYYTATSPVAICYEETLPNATVVKAIVRGQVKKSKLYGYDVEPGSNEEKATLESLWTHGITIDQEK